MGKILAAFTMDDMERLSDPKYALFQNGFRHKAIAQINRLRKPKTTLSDRIAGKTTAGKIVRATGAIGTGVAIGLGAHKRIGRAIGSAFKKEGHQEGNTFKNTFKYPEPPKGGKGGKGGKGKKSGGGYNEVSSPGSGSYGYSNPNIKLD